MKRAAVIAVSFFTLAACETNERMGQVIGGLIGAGVGYAAAGDDDDTVKAVAVLAGAGLGAWIGGNIGRGLDERERERMASTTQRALAFDAPTNASYRNPGSPSETGAGAPSYSWTSPTHPGVSGRSALLDATSAPRGGECRTVRQVVVRNGRETMEDVRFCRTGPSSPWAPA